MEEIEFSRWLFEGRLRQGKNVLPDGLNWLYYFAGSSKSHRENSISFIFLESPHQVDIKTLSNPPNTFLGISILQKLIVVAKSLPYWLSQFRKDKLRQPTGQRLSNVRTQQQQISIGPILFLCYEESLVSSNLNSKLFRFHGVRPNIGII